MSRKRVERDLPDLASVFPDFRGFDTKNNQTHSLTKILRTLALDVQENEPITFYSLRQIAAFFEVPYATVARVYKQLHEEGVLVRLRGSATLVQPKKIQPRRPVHGVVGIPIWLYGFLHFNDWRSFYFSLEENLRKQGLVADFVFFHTADAAHPDLGERLIQHHLDYLVWFNPGKPSIPIMQRLDDGGVRVITLSSPLQEFPFYNYKLNWSQSTRRAFSRWCQEGVTDVIIIQDPAATEYLPQLKEELKTHKLNASFLDPAKDGPENSVRLLEEQPKAAVVFFEVHRNLLLSSYIDIPRLMKQRKCLIRTRLDIHFEDLKGIKIHSMVMDWNRVTQRIAEDITTGRIFSDKEPHVFQADLKTDQHADVFGMTY